MRPPLVRVRTLAAAAKVIAFAPVIFRDSIDCVVCALIAPVRLTSAPVEVMAAAAAWLTEVMRFVLSLSEP